MMTSKFTAHALLLISLIALTGCNKEPAKPQAVVMNMTAVTEAVNMPDRLKAFSKAESDRINAEMKELGARYMKELEDTEAGFGEEPTQEQQDQLKRMRSRLQQQFNQARLTANVQMNKEKKALRESILDEVSPTAQQVAAEHGATIILKDDSVFWSEGTHDITEEVLGRLPVVEEDQPSGTAEPAEAE